MCQSESVQVSVRWALLQSLGYLYFPCALGLKTQRGPSRPQQYPVKRKKKNDCAFLEISSKLSKENIRQYLTTPSLARRLLPGSSVALFLEACERLNRLLQYKSEQWAQASYHRHRTADTDVELVYSINIPDMKLK